MGDQPTAQVRLGSYVLEERIGKGGMGDVYRARHVRLGSVHAIKLLRPDAAAALDVRERLLAEGRIQAQIRHEHLVPVTDVLEENGVVGLVMDFVEGRSLDAEMTENPGPLPYPMVRRVFVQVLSALSAVHARGVVHRDLKPSNILLSRRDGELHARLIDFGIAKVELPEGLSLTKQGLTLGTAHYMSPEQVRAEPITPASDLFSLGIVLYLVATGKLPFEGDSQWKVLSAISEGRYEPPERARPGLPPLLADVVRRALAPRPADRFPSADAFARALALALPEPGEAGATRAEIAALRRRDTRRRRLSVGVSAALLVALGAVAATLVGTSRAEGPPDAPGRSAGFVRADPRSGLVFVRLPGGEFLRGCLEGDAECGRDEPPAAPARVAPFWMSRTETTLQAWSRCGAARRCTTTPQRSPDCHLDLARPALPAACVTWAEAGAFCGWLGARLPTADEWEYAARDGRPLLFPWGRTPPAPRHARFLAPDLGPEEAGAHVFGATQGGLLDMAGNVWEWTADDLRGRKEVRGGSFRSRARWLRTSNRFSVHPDRRLDSVGFRCVFDDDAPPPGASGR